MADLVERVERIIVRALAYQDAYARSGSNEPDSEEVTRAVINAVANECESTNAPWLAAWLRSQANDGGGG